MGITIDLANIFDLMSFSTALMLGFLFLFKPPKANLFLGLFLICLALEILQPLSQGLSEWNAFDIRFSLQTTLFTLVFLLLYIKRAIHKMILKSELLLFIPGILINILFAGNLEDEPPFILNFFEYFFNLAIIGYLFFILKKHQKTLVDFYSEIAEKTLSWIKNILLVFIFFNVIWIIEDIIGLQSEILPEFLSFTSTLITFFLVYWIGYKGLTQPEIFKETLFKNSNEPKPEVIEKTIPQSEEDTIFFNSLKEKIASEKLYTNTDINLRALAIELNIKEKELSRLINTYANTNFYHFINAYRVNEFKNLLQSSKAEQLSTLGLAQEAGFSSKSTFYTAFKKLEGMTPKQYELSLKKSE